MRKKIKQKIHNDSKKSCKPIIEKKINLMTPVYLHRKINLNNNILEKKTPKNKNFPIIIGDNKLNFSLKNKISNNSIKNIVMNSIENNKNKEIKREKNQLKCNNYTNIGFISETISNILNKKKVYKNYEKALLGTKKSGKNQKKDATIENKENIRTNYNEKTNISINLNNYNNINKLENNLNINNVMIQNDNNNLYSSVQRNNYIKKKIINFGQKKNINNTNNNLNISGFNTIKNAKDNCISNDRSQKIRKKTNNFIKNNDDNYYTNRIIEDYTSSNCHNFTYNNKNYNYLYDNYSFVGNSSLQKRKISFGDYNNNTPDNSKHAINYSINDNSENRVTNSCYLDNILSFRKVKPKIFYKSPLNKCSIGSLQTGKISRDFSENKENNCRTKSFISKTNLIKFPSSRDTTFKKLNIKNYVNSKNNQNSYFSLNYTNTDTNDNTSMDSCNKKILEKLKKNSLNGQKSKYYLKIKKVIKGYANKENKNIIKKIERKKNNKPISGIIKYNCWNKDKFNFSHRTLSNFNTKSAKGQNLIDVNDIIIKAINNKEFSLFKKRKKLSKSSSILHLRNINSNDKIGSLKKNKYKIITPKKSENKHINKILFNSIKNVSQGDKNEKEFDKNNQANQLKSPIFGKITDNNSNGLSNIATSHKNNSGSNINKNTSNSSFIINEIENYTKKNCDEINNNIKIKIYEEEKIIDFDLLYTLESKLKMLLIKINNYQICYNECQDWLSYFFGTNFYEKELILFNLEQNKNQMMNFIKFELLCFMMCYDISFNKNYNQTSLLLKTIFNLLQKNFLILIYYAINTIYENNENKDKNIINNINYNEQMIIIKKLQEVINNELKMNLENQDISELLILQIFSDNFKLIKNYFEMIIENIYSMMNDINTNIISSDINDNKKPYYYNFPDCLKINIIKLNDKKKSYIISKFFRNTLESIDLYTIKDFKLFFNLYLNKSTDNLFIQQYYNNRRIYSLIPYPPSSSPINPEKVLLPPINSKKFNYTIILDLDETLIYLEKEYYTFNNIHNIKNKKLTLRPGLFNFLDRMKKIYEIILFTFSSPEYASPIIQLIEKEGKYFEHILYIQQAIYMNGSYVKNIQYLGRDIKKTIIIEDNINNISKFNRDNAICIKPFYGDISNEKNTLQLLGNILNKIRYDAEITGDIVKSLHKEKYNIITEISSNLEE